MTRMVCRAAVIRHPGIPLYFLYLFLYNYTLIVSITFKTKKELYANHQISHQTNEADHRSP